MKLLVFLGALSAMFLSGQALALDYFVGIDGSRSTVDITGVSYSPVLKRARFGMFIKRGIGVELNAANTQKFEETDDLKVGIDSHYAALLRLQSPSEKGLSVYVNLGYSVSELFVGNISGGDNLQKENLESPFASFGFQKQIKFFPSVSYFGEYDRIFKDDNVRITAWSFGYQFNF